jgi:hypothetical protein
MANATPTPTVADAIEAVVESENSLKAAMEAFQSQTVVTKAAPAILQGTLPARRDPEVIKLPGGTVMVKN